MASTFTIRAAFPTQRMSGGQLEDVIEASGYTVPHEVPFTVTVAKKPGWRDELAARAATEAAELESVFEL